MVFRDSGEQPHAEVALANGDRVAIVLSNRGVAISQIRGQDAAAPVFEAGPAAVAHICAGLVDASNTASPLRILASAVVQLGSADDVRRAFAQVAAQVP